MNIKDIEPTLGNVLVELPEQTTEVGGLIIAGDQSNTAPVRGTIVRIPEGGSQFKVGEVVFFRKYAIDELKFTEEDLATTTVFIVDEKEILGVVRPIEEKAEFDAPTVRAETKEHDQALKDKS